MQHDSIWCHLWPQKAKTPPPRPTDGEKLQRHSTQLSTFPRSWKSPVSAARGTQPLSRHIFSPSAPQGQESRALGMETAPNPAFTLCPCEGCKEPPEARGCRDPGEAKDNFGESLSPHTKPQMPPHQLHLTCYLCSPVLTGWGMLGLAPHKYPKGPMSS